MTNTVRPDLQRVSSRIQAHRSPSLNSPALDVPADYSQLLEPFGRVVPAPVQLRRRGAVPGGPGPNGPAWRGKAEAPGLEVRQFKTLQGHSAATHQDQHGVLVDYHVFVNVPAGSDGTTVRRCVGRAIDGLQDQGRFGGCR